MRRINAIVAPTSGARKAPHMKVAPGHPAKRRGTMTPQERQMVADLFDRPASLEGEGRDPDAERVMPEGWGRAPNEVYALGQTKLAQYDALKRAPAQIDAL